MVCNKSRRGLGMDRREAREGAGRRVRGGALAVLVAGMLVLAGCVDSFTVAQLQEESCVKRRLDAAAIAYDDAKSQIEEHFKVRSDTSLRFAYQSSLDSSRLVRSIRNCFDFDRSLIPQAREMLRSNSILRRLVRANLRDNDAQQAIGIFGDRYREIFKNDIN